MLRVDQLLRAFSSPATNSQLGFYLESNLATQALLLLCCFILGFIVFMEEKQTYIIFSQVAGFLQTASDFL